MSDKQDVAGGSQEPAGLPTPTISAASSGDGSAPFDKAAFLEEARAAAREEAVKAAQSIKDKRIAEQGGRLDELELVLAQLSPADARKAKEALREARVDELLNRDRKVVQPDNGMSDDDLETKARKVLSKTGLSEAEQQEVAKVFAGKRYTSEVDYLAELSGAAITFANNQAKQKAPVSSGAAIMYGGGHAPQDGAPEEEYRKEVELIRAGKHPTIRRGNTNAFLDLQRKYREKGATI